VGDRVALSEAVRTYQRVTEENASSFHLHSDRDDLPLTAMLVFPPDEKSSTILAARYNANPAMQAVRPTRVIDELIAFVVRLRSVFDAIALLLGASTAILLGLIVALSVRIRAEELATLGEIGVSRRSVTAVALGELVVIAGLAACLGVVLVVVLVGLVAGLVSIG
jgi:ABC-type antimicrobial peptide transport system permease subunit